MIFLLYSQHSFSIDTTLLLSFVLILPIILLPVGVISFIFWLAKAIGRKEKSSVIVDQFLFALLFLVIFLGLYATMRAAPHLAISF